MKQLNHPNGPGSLPAPGCMECNPYETCPKCKYLYENGGQCGGCHVFYLDEEQQQDYIDSMSSVECAELRREQ